MRLDSWQSRNRELSSSLPNQLIVEYLHRCCLRTRCIIPKPRQQNHLTSRPLDFIWRSKKATHTWCKGKDLAIKSISWNDDVMAVGADKRLISGGHTYPQWRRQDLSTSRSSSWAEMEHGWDISCKWRSKRSCIYMGQEGSKISTRYYPS